MLLEDFSDLAVRYAIEHGAQYCDIRAENISSSSVLIENGEVEYCISEADFGLGIRVLVNGAWGFCSISKPKFLDEIHDKIKGAISSALYYSTRKKEKVTLAKTKSHLDVVKFNVKKEPSIDEMISLGLDCDKIIRSGKRIRKSSVYLHHDKIKKYFVNSEESKISQSFADVTTTLSGTSHESGLTQTVSTTEGGRGGMEIFMGKNDLRKIAESTTTKADSLLDAKTAKEEKTTVVMNPDFVALLTHEILGHPSEADRVLGKEMAWAGGAWWAGKLGTSIGSSELNVVDDPTIPHTLGWFRYDDEGVSSSKKILVKDGILTNHMQSRETASIFNTEPNSSMRTSGYSYMPLVRMACTCILPGNWNAEEIIKDVKSGYLISGMKIPSIDMMRYNWNISCQYAHKIENGEIKDLLRDVIVMGTSPDFFNSIDACGNDFTVRPITNCGKGDPMQIMKMGNGGPHIRGIATVKSVIL